MTDPPPAATPASAVEPDPARRKAKGAYYTPKDLVDEAVERALGPLLSARTPEQAARLRILDPACGSGAFLLGAARLLDRLPWDGPRPELHGVDLDPAAAAACRAGLQAAGVPRADVRVADWLLDGPPRRRWDAVVGNPPWVGTRSLPRARRRQLGGLYGTATGQFDLFAPFVERTAASLAPGGRAALVLPDRWLLNPDSRPLRRHVLAHTALEEVVRLGEGSFAGVSMPAALVVFTPPTGSPPVVTVRDGPGGPPRRLQVARFSAWDEARLPLHLTPEEVARAEALAGRGPRLHELVRHGRGVEVGRRSPWVRDEPGPDTAPILFGQDVDRYRLGPGRHIVLSAPGVDYKAPWLYAPPKLLLRKTGLGIRAALDETDRLVSQVVYVLRARDPALDPAWLLGVLGSSALSFLHRARNGEADKASFPHLRQTDVLALTVPRPAPQDVAEVAALARRRMACDEPEEAARLEETIDRRVAAAYGEPV